MAVLWNINKTYIKQLSTAFSKPILTLIIGDGKRASENMSGEVNLASGNLFEGSVGWRV